jgi:uncharacterized protein
MDGSSTTTLRISRPTIVVDGQDRPTLASGLLSLLIIEDTQGLYRCEMVIGNWGSLNNRIGYLYFDRQVLDFGKGLKVKVENDTLFDGRIMALEGRFPEGSPPTLVVLTEDRFQDLRMTRRTRTFDNISDSSLLSQIASDHGLSPNVNLSGPTHKVLAQVNQSDLAFARERARAAGAELWIDGTTLHASNRAGRAGDTLNLAHGSNLREFNVIADLARQRTAVVASGWDVSGKQAISYEAGSSLISGDLNGDQSGMSLLQSSLGERKETLAHTVPLASDEAQAVAEAYCRTMAWRFVVGHGVTETDARLHVGTTVNLSNLGSLFNGRYYVTEVRHKFDTLHGLHSEFTAERPGIGQ